MSRRRFLHTASVGVAAATTVRGLGMPAVPERRMRVGQIGTAHAHAGSKWATLLSMPDRRLQDVLLRACDHADTQGGNL